MSISGKDQLYASTVIRQLIDCQDLDGHISSLESPWREISEAIAACPADSTQRSQAFEAAIANLADQDQIREHVFAADINADVSALRPKDRYHVHWAEEAFEPQPPIDWIVESLFSVGSVSALFGDGGSGKTYAMIDCAVCVAQGNPWLDQKTKQSVVLIVDEESGLKRLKRRIRLSMMAHKANRGLPLGFVTMAQFDLRLPEYVSKLEEVIHRSGAKLVIIDALADVMPGGDENSVKDLQPIFMILRNIAESTQSAIVVIHHANRGGGYRGSSALKGSVDLLLKIVLEKDTSLMKFSSEKCRDIDTVSFIAQLHITHDSAWLTKHLSNSTKSSVLTRAQQSVIRYLAENASGTVNDILASADGVSKESTRKAIYQLAKPVFGYVERADGGGSGKKATYRLTTEGEKYAKNQGYS